MIAASPVLLTRGVDRVGQRLSRGWFLLPTRNGELFRWCLQNRLRLVHQMTLMTIGLYNEPSGAYLPAVTY